MKNSQYPLISRKEALHFILDRSVFLPRIEMVPVREALGRITVREVLAENTLPNSPISSMDGIAIKSANLTGCIPDTDAWREGVDYAFSNTGVGIQDDFNTVVQIEDVEIDEAGKLRILRIPEPGQNVRPVGDIIRTGDVLVPSHYCLGPMQLGLLSTGGVKEVAVLTKPRVAILPTGNELVPVHCNPPRGKTVESNGIMMEAQITLMGGEPCLYPIIRDNPHELIIGIQDALAWADIVILIGGSSKGTDDRAVEVLESIGEILVYELDSGPGKHTTLTMAGSKPIIGAVGPTMGAAHAVEWYVGPLIDKYLFQPTIAPKRLKVELLEDILEPLAFTWLEVHRVKESYVAKQIGRLASLSRQMLSNATLHIPDRKGHKAGEVVEVELRYPLEWIPNL